MVQFSNYEEVYRVLDDLVCLKRLVDGLMFEEWDAEKSRKACSDLWIIIKERSADTPISEFALITDGQLSIKTLALQFSDSEARKVFISDVVDHMQELMDPNDRIANVSFEEIHKKIDEICRRPYLHNRAMVHDEDGGLTSFDEGYRNPVFDKTTIYESLDSGLVEAGYYASLTVAKQIPMLRQSIEDVITKFKITLNTDTGEDNGSIVGVAKAAPKQKQHKDRSLELFFKREARSCMEFMKQEIANSRRQGKHIACLILVFDKQGYLNDWRESREQEALCNAIRREYSDIITSLRSKSNNSITSYLKENNGNGHEVSESEKDKMVKRFENYIKTTIPPVDIS